MGDLIIFILILFGSALGCLLLWKIFDMVRSSIHKNKALYDEEVFEKLAKAFINHKKETEQRLQRIEAALAGVKSEYPQKEINESYETLHIENTEPNTSNTVEKTRSQS